MVCAAGWLSPSAIYLKRTKPRHLQTTNPQSTSPAFHFITTRLIDSFDLPAGVAKYYEWMNLPTGDEFFVRGTSRRTIDDSMPAIRATIDAGHPCSLGLVCVHSSHPQDLGQNHQVLAYGYTDTATTTTLRLYDCNHPDDDARDDHVRPHAARITRRSSATPTTITTWSASSRASTRRRIRRRCSSNDLRRTPGCT